MRVRTLLPLLLLGVSGDQHAARTLNPDAIARYLAAEPYEELMTQSLRGWDEFRKRFKDVTELTMTKDGDVTVLRGKAEVYFVKGSTFEARFASATQITRLVVTLDPANAKDRRLRSDLSNRIAKGQPDLEEWLPKPVRDKRDQLLVETITIDFAEGNSPSKASLVSTIPLAFEPIPGLGLRADSMQFAFAVTDPGNRDRTGLSATLSANVAIGASKARLSGTIQSRESRETWALAAELGDIELRPLLESVAGATALNGMVIPREIASLGLKKAVLTVDQSKGSASAKATSALGDVELKAARGKSGAAFQLGIAPSGSFKFASLAPELSIMDGLGLQNSAIVVASEATHTDLSVFSTVGNAQDVDRGVTMMGGLNLRGASPKMASLLGVETLVMRGTLGTSMSQVRLAANVATEIQLVPGNAGAAVLRGISVRLTPNPAGPTLALGGKVDVRASRQVLTFDADVDVDFAGPSFFVEGKLSAVDGKAGAFWTNPFGVSKGLAVRDLGLALGINLGAPIPLPILGLQGELVAGNMDSPSFHGHAAIGIDPADPQKTVIDLGIDQLTVRQIMGAAAPQALASVPRELQYTLDLGLHDVRLTVVPSPSGADLFGVHYDPGFLVQGSTKIGDWSGELYVSLDYDKGLEARATADAIHAEPFFALTGARGAPNPYINIAIGPSANSFVAMSGLVNVLGMQAESDVLIYAEGFDVYVAGKVLGGVFDASVEVAGGNLKNGGTLYAVAEMKNDLFRYMTDNASRQINAATTDMQAQISDAQRKVSAAQNDIRGFDNDIAQYRAQLEANRQRTCTDIRNGNADVHAREQEVAAARRSLDNLTNDAGVVAARNRVVAAEQQVNSARAAVNGIEQDPGVVQARNRLASAHGELTRAQGAVAALDNDPGVLDARRKFAAAEANVNSLVASINRANAELNSLQSQYNALSGIEKLSPRAVQLVALIAAKGSERTGYQAGHATAMGVLQAAQAAMNGSIQTAQQAANAGIVVAQQSVTVSQQAYDGSISAARQVATAGIQAAEGTLQTSRQAYDGLIQAGQQTAQGAIRVAEGSLQAAQATAQTAYNACVAAPIEVDPRLAGLIGSREISMGTLKGANLFLEGVKQTATGTMVAADWIVKNGNPLGVVNIEYAKFEGCLATMDGGKVSLQYRGKFAGSPISGALDLNIASPAEAVSYLADYLLKNKSGPIQPSSAGGCTKPTFARRPGAPQMHGASSRIAANPADLKGAAPTIPALQKPAGLGQLPKGAP